MKRTDIAIAAAPDAAKARFWSNVLLPDANGCMDWRGVQMKCGYGQISIKNVRVLVHRCSLWWMYGPPAAEGLEAAHGCNRKICVAPEHLRWATGRENTADQLIHGTRARGSLNGRSRLTEDRVREICEAYTRESLTVSALAVRFGITQSSASRILNGVDWGWLGIAPGGPGPVAEKTHCKHGHEFTPENTRISVKPGRSQRECRTCIRARQRKATS